MILKKNNSELPQSKAAEEAYKKWKKSKSQKDAEEFMDIWTREVYLPARQKGIMVDPDPEIVSAASGHVEHPEWVKKTEQKAFGTTADKLTKDKPVAREVGTVAGSAALGLVGGLTVHGIAKSGPRILDRATWKPIKKVVEENGKKVEKVIELKERPVVAKLTRKLRPGAEKLEKFAKTKGGKAALIGVPTAIVGGVLYKSVKKKDKKDKEEGKK